MKKSQLKSIIKEVISEMNDENTFSPNVKRRMIQRLTAAIEHVISSNNVEELASLDGAEYDSKKGTLMVTIYNNHIDR